MSRPPLPPDQRRAERIHVLLTAEERVAIEGHAAAHGLSLSDYLRRRGLALRLPSAARRERAGEITTLHRLGVNLNQIAHHMNAGRGAPPELEALIAKIEAGVNRLLDDFD